MKPIFIDHRDRLIAVWEAAQISGDPVAQAAATAALAVWDEEHPA